jgi:hypothetical protein
MRWESVYDTLHRHGAKGIGIFRRSGVWAWLGWACNWVGSGWGAVLYIWDMGPACLYSSGEEVEALSVNRSRTGTSPKVGRGVRGRGSVKLDVWILHPLHILSNNPYCSWHPDLVRGFGFIRRGWCLKLVVFCVKKVVTSEGNLDRGGSQRIPQNLLKLR